jgi:hypothetical protein
MAPGAVAINQPNSAVATDARKAGAHGGSAAAESGVVASRYARQSAAGGVPTGSRTRGGQLEVA